MPGVRKVDSSKQICGTCLDSEISYPSFFPFWWIWLGLMGLGYPVLLFEYSFGDVVDIDREGIPSNTPDRNPSFLYWKRQFQCPKVRYVQDLLQSVSKVAEVVLSQLFGVNWILSSSVDISCPTKLPMVTGQTKRLMELWNAVSSGNILSSNVLELVARIPQLKSHS